MAPDQGLRPPIRPRHAPRSGRIWVTLAGGALGLPPSWPADPPYLRPIADGQWHEYVGNQIHRDLSINPETQAVTTLACYTLAATAGVAVRRAALGPRAVPPYLADGALVAMEGGPGVPPGSQRFFHADMLATTRLLTDGDGNVSQSLAFTAFGELLGTAAAALRVFTCASGVVAVPPASWASCYRARAPLGHATHPLGHATRPSGDEVDQIQ